MALSSWVPGADGSGFPAEHLPYGVFSIAGERGDQPRVGVRIGDSVLDLARLADAGLVEGPFDRPALNDFLALGPDHWAATRARLTQLVCDTSSRSSITGVTDVTAVTGVDGALVPADRVALHLPFEVADYVDFYSSIEHATNMGRLLRPGGEPLLPNWRHLPVAYHGRAGTVVVSGTPIVRPSGQRRSPDGPDGSVSFGPTGRLDIELEVGFVVGTPSSQGRPVPVDRAADHVFGVVLVNDWSARDIQAWEYQPLGPFLGKSFATTVSGWVTPLAALDGCRVAGPVQQPEPLPYLRTREPWGLALDLEVALAPSGSSGPDALTTVSRTSFAGLYWTLPQQIAHLTVNGASLRTGDLLASGTVSGATPGTEGSLMELTRGGAAPIDVGGATRTFLEDGDEVVLRGRARVGDGVVLTLGEAAGRIVPGSS